MGTVRTVSAILTDGFAILDARCNCTDEEIERLNDEALRILGPEFRWEACR